MITAEGKNLGTVLYESLLVIDSGIYVVIRTSCFVWTEAFRVFIYCGFCKTQRLGRDSNDIY